MNIDITNYLEKLKNTEEQKKKEFKNHRDELVKKTVATLKEERKKWKPDEIYIVSEERIAVLFNKKFGGSNYDLYIFLTKCKNSNSFSYNFWEKFKSKKETK